MKTNLIYHISKGDEAAFEAFMDQYSEALYRYVNAIVKDKETAEEVVSDVFMEVWNKRKTLLEIDNISGWLHTVAYRKTVSVLRHEGTIPMHVNLDDVENFTADQAESADDFMIEKDEIDMLYEAIEELPDKCKHVFYLAKIDKMPYKEIASRLSISVATINYHVGFAMGTLKKKLQRGKK